MYGHHVTGLIQWLSRIYVRGEINSFMVILYLTRFSYHLKQISKDPILTILDISGIAADLTKAGFIDDLVKVLPKANNDPCFAIQSVMPNYTDIISVTHIYKRLKVLPKAKNDPHVVIQIAIQNDIDTDMLSVTHMNSASS